MARKRYTEEFKREAVRLMLIDGLSAVEVSGKLGVSQGMLYKWRQSHLEKMGDAAKKDSDLSPAELAAELEQVRKKLARSERINEILKKTVVYFAKDER